MIDVDGQKRAAGEAAGEGANVQYMGDALGAKEEEGA